MVALDLRNWLIERITADLRITRAQLDLDKDLAMQGLDSLLAVALVGDLEDLLSCSLSPTLLAEYTTINSIVQYLIELIELDEAVPQALAR